MTQPKHSLRTAAYCRVSTEKDMQEHSYEAQQAYFRQRISSDPTMTLVGIYGDIGKTGRSIHHRDGLQQLLQDCEDGKIDLVLVKSLSRFSRNLVDCLTMVRRLRKLRIPVIFEKEGIRSLDLSAGVVFSLLAAVAQDESRSISEDVRWRYATRFAKGDYNIGSNRILGYDSVDGKLVPNEQAWIIRHIFELYTQGRTLTEIEADLTSRQVMGLRMKRPVKTTSILSILQNETYVGDKHLQKQPLLDFLTKRPDPHAERVSYYLTDDHEGIIDRATWEQTKARLSKKQEEVKQGIYRHGKHHPLYGKLFCGFCGAPYKRRTVCACQAQGGGLYKAWNCRERQKRRHGNGCRNRIVREERMMEEIKKTIRTDKKGAVLEKVQKVLVYEDHVEAIMT